MDHIIKCTEEAFKGLETKLELNMKKLVAFIVFFYVHCAYKVKKMSYIINK